MPKKATSKLGRRTTLKFIDLLKNYPCLCKVCTSIWDLKLRQDAFESLCDVMNIPGFGVPEARYKINTLRSSYMQERKKVIASEAVAGVGRVYVPKLYYYNDFDEIYNNCLADNVSMTESLRKSQTVPDEQLIDSDFSSSTTTQDPLEINPNKRPAPTNASEVSLKVPRTEQVPRTSTIDPFELFAQSVAVQLKNMSTERALLAQAKIQAILTEYAIQDLREKQSSPSIIERPVSIIKEDMLEIEEETINDCNYD